MFTETEKRHESLRKLIGNQIGETNPMISKFNLPLAYPVSLPYLELPGKARIWFLEFKIQNTKQNMARELRENQLFRWYMRQPSYRSLIIHTLGDTW